MTKQNNTTKIGAQGDRIEGDTIILYDNYPNEHRLLKLVKIVTPEGMEIRKIKKTKKGGYLFN